MYSLFVRHHVQDYAKWKPVFDQHEVARREYGITSYSLHRDFNDRNTIIIALRATDLKKAQEFVESPTLREAMERGGVQGQPEFWFTEDIEDKRY